MKIKFDSTLEFQKHAIEALTEVFNGNDACNSNFTVYSPSFIEQQKKLELNVIGYGNRIGSNLLESAILENVQNTQLTNGLKPSSREEVDKKKLDFTIEMETGTGKTYVYLRSIMELYRKYNFSKHIIVVPSVPIKEGVYKSLQITESHFKELYDNVNYNFFIYDSSKLNEVRDFAVNDGLNIMIINIAAFNKSFKNPNNKKDKANIIHRYNDKLGYVPLELIQNTNPMIYIDEPQSTMNTELSRKAVHKLNPLAIVRYSATHREKINLLYKLDAVDAYEQKLVKQIEVGSIQTEGSNNQAYIKLLKIETKKGQIQAKIEIDALKKGKISRISITVKQNADLEELTNRLEYEGYIIRDIYAAQDNEYIDFTGREEILKLGEAIGSVDDKQIKTAMISKTIEEHLDKELHLNARGIKVLTLFFIDSVKKYRIYDDEGNASNGEYAEIFEKEYQRIIARPKYATLFDKILDKNVPVSEVHNGYFSIDKKSKSSNKKDKFEYFKDTKGNTNADEDTYSLIMRDKEKLLSFKLKLRFIFSHSALKEGWDNPNVFQICTLKEAGASEIRRRQEIGRGLRLCVNQDGERVMGHDVNILTVIATESYKDFADNLQKEIEKETGIRFGIVETHTFSNVVTSIDGDETHYLGQEKSEQLYNFLLEKEYIDKKGKVQESLRTDLKNNQVHLPEEFSEDKKIYHQIINNIKKVAGKLEIKEQAKKVAVKLNKQVITSPEFKALWDKVKYKTTFSVEFDSDELIKACANAISERIKISRGKLHYTKALVNKTRGGIETANEVTETDNLHYESDNLPDIVTYLQNETQLTRKSIVQILLDSDRLNYFKINPQKFIEGCISIINEQMRYHIIDGVEYHKIGENDFYEQKLFENEELFGYLKTNLKESSKSPYNQIVYDSKTELTLVEEFEKNKNISVYTKLPSWFKIDTPLGTYNPDWAILWKDAMEEKLFFVVESKGSTSLFDLRPQEQGKIECGKKHFKEIGSEMIVASSIDDVVNYALEKKNV